MLCSEVVIQKGVLQGAAWIDLLSKVSKQFVIITDQRVKGLLGDFLKKRLEDAGYAVSLFSVPQGEKSKTRSWKESLEDQLLEAGLGRDGAVIALGGGVITDLAGFVAATYCRGIPLVSIPTTLLGQVDASIGGKVGVNTLQGKNLIGAYHPPRLILIDPDTLSTLPPGELLNGMAEVIKYALIASKGLFKELQKGIEWEACIQKCCAIKQKIVSEDPQEGGVRRILNFGHTVGHALETLSDYQLSHGEAVAIGMVVESRLSYRLGYLKEEELEDIYTVLKKYHFSLRLPAAIDEKEWMRIMSRDKKALSNRPRFVLLQSIGEVLPFEGAYCSFVDPELVLEALQWLRLK